MRIIRIIKKFSSILSTKQKKRVIMLAFMMIIGGLLEMLSISLIIPFMDALMNQSETMDKWYVVLFCDLASIESPQQFLVVLSVVLAFVYIFKNLFLIVEYNFQYKFVYGNMFEMQRRLLDSFLHRPYEYYLGIDSGEVIRIINVDTSHAFSLLSTVLNLFTELVVSAILVATIFIITPFISVCIAIALLILVLLIDRLLKPSLRKAGLEYQKASAGINKWLIQSINGIKELIVMQKEDYFQNRFDVFGEKHVQSMRKKNIFAVLPRFLIEATSMSTMFVVLAVLILRGIKIESIIPVLTAIAMAALRLLPSINRISSALAEVSYSESMLDKMIENLRNVQNDNTEYIRSENKENYYRVTNNKKLEEKIEIRDLTYRYPGSSVFVLHDANMSIKRGESVGLVGASGAGKTTTVDLIIGLLQPENGGVFVDGIDIRNDIATWRSQIGYIPQMIFMLDDSIKANVAFGVNEDKISEEAVWEALKEASLDKFVESLPDGIYTELGERGVRLSGGQRQRIGIARALYINPSILIFDEATSALDTETERDIIESIENLHGKKTMIIIAHRRSTIEGCDHIFRVEKGNIVIEK